MAENEAGRPGQARPNWPGQMHAYWEWAGYHFQRWHPVFRICKTEYTKQRALFKSEFYTVPYPNLTDHSYRSPNRHWTILLSIRMPPPNSKGTLYDGNMSWKGTELFFNNEILQKLITSYRLLYQPKPKHLLLQATVRVWGQWTCPVQIHSGNVIAKFIIGFILMWYYLKQAISGSGT